MARMTVKLGGEAATLALGRALGGLLGPGAVILLKGELGAGKTVLARGIARGLGGRRNPVTSPSFTLLNLYPGRLPFHHADLYRLSPAEADDLFLLEEAADGVLAVEWPERGGETWPPERLVVELAVEAEDERVAGLEGPDELLAGLGDALAARPADGLLILD